ncbi:MAG: bifunctional D-glycero-beta-D-manno-heptose-7-phosphate kinase/D-glycero-beta-D-manno-heptose 1-phosphate adenylyltransferase HldE [Gammaproteobacteria bacterium]
MTLTIPDFSQLRILVVGDAMLDEYWFGDTSRISPEAPVPVVRTRSKKQRPGGAANVAVNLTALGADTRLVAVVGNDPRGAKLRTLLEGSGVCCKLLECNSPTIHKLRVMSRSQQLIRLDSEQILSGHGEAFAGLFAEEIKDVHIIVISDYGKGTLDDIQGLIALGRQAGVPMIVDPKGQDFERYRGATILTPNQGEFEAEAGSWSDEGKFLIKGEAFRTNLDLEALLVTRGEKGMTLFARGKPPLSLVAETREVFDVTGAGDTVIALLGAGIGSGLALADAAALANLGAGLVIRKIGAATVAPSELRLALHRRGMGGRGLLGADQLVECVNQAKARGERVVMTNGCFDILHAGHVSYLEEAKALGDRLVVAVNDDESVKTLKGASRPVTKLEDRMAVLAGLAAVDWVVAFAGETPADLIARVRPDVLVKGGDYRAEEIAGSQSVIANGGEIKVLALKKGRSTSAMIEDIRKKT